MINIRCVTVGLVCANCYIVTADGRKDAVLIDPGDDYDEIDKALDKAGLTPAAILLTHAHFDHTNAAGRFAKRGCRIYLGRDDEILVHTDMNMADAMGGVFMPYEPDILVTDGSVIEECGITFRVVSTPGHTVGSVCYITDNVIFTGDTLFCLGVGRTDLPTGNGRMLEESVHKLYALSGDYKVYPGHGESTTLEFERKHNPYV